VLPRQHVTFLSDGGDTVRELPAYLHPHSEHILDWFHIGMRAEQLSQTARGFRGTDECRMTKEKILNSPIAVSALPDNSVVSLRTDLLPVGVGVRSPPAV
jgi:hypothetical protein